MPSQPSERRGVHRRQVFRRHNSCVDFTFLPHISSTNSYKLKRLNSIFEKALDKRTGFVREDKLLRILPSGPLSELKYGNLFHGTRRSSKDSGKHDRRRKKEPLRLISRGRFLAMFAHESVSFLNTLAMNEKNDRDNRHRRTHSQGNKSSANKQMPSVSSMKRSGSRGKLSLADGSGNNSDANPVSSSLKETSSLASSGGRQTENRNGAKQSSRSRKSSKNRDKKVRAGNDQLKKKKHRSKSQAHTRKEKSISNDSKELPTEKSGEDMITNENSTNTNEGKGTTTSPIKSSSAICDRLIVFDSASQGTTNRKESNRELNAYAKPSESSTVNTKSHDHSINGQQTPERDKTETVQKNSHGDTTSESDLCVFLSSFLTFFKKTFPSKTDTIISRSEGIGYFSGSTSQNRLSRLKAPDDSRQGRSSRYSRSGDSSSINSSRESSATNSGRSKKTYTHQRTNSNNYGSPFHENFDRPSNTANGEVGSLSKREKRKKKNSRTPAKTGIQAWS